MGMAARGHKVAVVTIDPARRLANSLGLEELGNEPRLVDPARFAGHGIEIEGELWAMMLDPKRTFDELIERLAPDERARDEVLRNPVYQQLSSAVAGSQEYTAMAKLYELARERDDFDLLVLDTPPARNALDFLDAPDRLTQFLEGRALRTFLRPTGLGMRIVGRGSGVVFGVLRRVTGIDLLENLSTFFTALGGMLEGFRERARGVDELLADPATTFLLVSSAEREPLAEALHLRDVLHESGLPFGGVIVNRVHHDPLADADIDAGALAQRLAPRLGAPLAARVAENAGDYHALAARDRRNLAELAQDVDPGQTLLVPQLDDDVHDIDGLVAVHRWLFAGDAERAAMLEEIVA